MREALIYYKNDLAGVLAGKATSWPWKIFAN